MSVVKQAAANTLKMEKTNAIKMNLEMSMHSAIGAQGYTVGVLCYNLRLRQYVKLSIKGRNVFIIQWLSIFFLNDYNIVPLLYRFRKMCADSGIRSLLSKLCFFRLLFKLSAIT